MPKTAHIEINLLPKDPFLASPIGRFLQWALTIGRYLVIFTEMVVIFSFATRFTLDRQITDLNSALHQKEIIILSYGDLETQVVNLQKKIGSYLQVEQQVNIADAFASLTQITPPDVSLTELTVTRTSILFSGVSKSSNSLDLLINNIQLSRSFSDVAVDKLESSNDQDPGFKFVIRANIKRDLQGKILQT